MLHNLRISVSKAPQLNGLVSCRDVSIRERLLRFLLGKKQRITILIPGDTVNEVTICESQKGENTNEQQPVT